MGQPPPPVPPTGLITLTALRLPGGVIGRLGLAGILHRREARWGVLVDGEQTFQLDCDDGSVPVIDWFALRARTHRYFSVSAS
ncbi:hypothetical protein [Microbacterium sp. 77mftsu3.1]|uniref:hypothetical protein n=1 Tax=Microbacterium sp. 77mftsu3.1 TaxID=1761802 RepID=UPI00039A796B|nr:hypothetical protein [Microbacterium sp. 77mftsu3.1]